MTGQALPLRDYQERIVDGALDALREGGSLLVAAPTGSGKTVCIADICRREIELGNRVGLLVHRQELITQSEQKIRDQSGRDPGVVWQGRREWDRPAVIMAQDTIAGMEMPALARFDLLMIDEAHHAVAPGWLRTVDRLRPRRLLGFSATPFRQDREPLSPRPFAQVIRPVTPMELIGRKLLCPAVIESPVIYDRTGSPQPINQASNPEQIYHQAVRYALAQGRSRILLYVSQTRTLSPMEVIGKTVRTLRNAGINTGGIYQNVSPQRRRNALSAFQDSASASVLVNYMALTEGTDLPNVDCVIVGRHTASESTIIQMIGRGLRPHGEKENCLVLDYTGRPDMSDIIHYWRLDQPEPEEEKAKRERPKSNTAVELEALATKFPRQINMMDDTRVQYPWFRPFIDRPLLALPVWNKENESGKYVTVEPLKRGGWKVCTITLMNRGPTQMRREQVITQGPEDAAARVRMAMGHMAPLLERGAEWRLKAPSQAQIQAWKRMRNGDRQDPEQMTAGEIWDSISQERFRRRVKPEAA